MFVESNLPTVMMYKHGDTGSEINDLQMRLSKYGYNMVINSEFDINLSNTVRAFHIHFNTHVKLDSGLWDEWNNNDEHILNTLINTLINMKDNELLHEEDCWVTLQSF